MLTFIYGGLILLEETGKVLMKLVLWKWMYIDFIKIKCKHGGIVNFALTWKMVNKQLKHVSTINLDSPCLKARPANPRIKSEFAHFGMCQDYASVKVFLAWG